jgi:hypothetical protein
MADTLEPEALPPLILRKKIRLPEEPHGGAGLPAMKIATTELPRKKVLPPKPAVPPANQGQR